MRLVRLECLAAGVALAAPALAQEDVKPGAPTFKEVDIISLDKIEQIKPFLPPEFWDNRDFFFYEGMQMEIGPSFADYSPPPVYTQATEKYSGAVKLGPESSLVNYRAGQPFPIDKIDCKGDPKAGAKIAWSFVRRWEGRPMPGWRLWPRRPAATAPQRLSTCRTLPAATTWSCDERPVPEDVRDGAAGPRRGCGWPAQIDRL